MLNPTMVIPDNLKYSLLALSSPFIFKVGLISDLSRDRRDVICCKNPIVHISTYLVPYDHFGVAVVHIALGEGCFLGDLCEDFESAGVSRKDVVIRSTVVGVNV
jgi:hypothetical protein